MIEVKIIETQGSTPRNVGAKMLVSPTHHLGTIGGGALEYHALELARTRSDFPFTLDLPLNALFGQCCGGRVKLAFAQTSETKLLAEVKPNALIFGKGPTGVALYNALSFLPFQTAIYDEREGDECEMLINAAPASSLFVFMTHSHALDYRLCEAALKRQDALYVGLIGSLTKRALFVKSYLQNQGQSQDLSIFHCPLGEKTTDKRPEVIAALTAAQILVFLNKKE